MSSFMVSICQFTLGYVRAVRWVRMDYQAHKTSWRVVESTLTCDEMRGLERVVSCMVN